MVTTNAHLNALHLRRKHAADSTNPERRYGERGWYAATLLDLATTQIELGEFEAAHEACMEARDILSGRPGEFRLWFVWAGVHRRWGEAMALFQHAVMAAPRLCIADAMSGAPR